MGLRSVQTTIQTGNEGSDHLFLAPSQMPFREMKVRMAHADRAIGDADLARPDIAQCYILDRQPPSDGAKDSGLHGVSRPAASLRGLGRA